MFSLQPLLLPLCLCCFWHCPVTPLPWPCSVAYSKLVFALGFWLFLASVLCLISGSLFTLLLLYCLCLLFLYSSLTEGTHSVGSGRHWLVESIILDNALPPSHLLGCWPPRVRCQPCCSQLQQEQWCHVVRNGDPGMSNPLKGAICLALIKERGIVFHILISWKISVVKGGVTIRPHLEDSKM